MADKIDFNLTETNDKLMHTQQLVVDIKLFNKNFIGRMCKFLAANRSKTNNCSKCDAPPFIMVVSETGNGGEETYCVLYCPDCGVASNFYEQPNDKLIDSWNTKAREAKHYTPDQMEYRDIHFRIEDDVYEDETVIFLDNEFNSVYDNRLLSSTTTLEEIDEEDIWVCQI
jgi:hypothetical protein